ncbi:hypothetical protein BG004_003510 [Podila humilis]|nr:hypothetical protein BG004_003510 [Podila humilis]
MSLSGGQFLDPEPASPSASTLVGSPMTPRPESGPFSWTVQPGQQPLGGSHLNPSHSPIPDSHQRSPMLNRFHSTNSLNDSKDGKDYHHASAARTLGNHQNGYLSQYSGKQSWDAASSSHVSVAMDDISLDSFSPSDSPPTTRKESSGLQRLYKKASMARGGGGGGRVYNRRDWANTPQGEFDRSSNNSIVTLLAQTNTNSTNSSSTTLFGSFGFKKAKSIDSDDMVVEIPKSKHKTDIDLGPDGKIYTMKPKVKKFGAKGKGNKKAGGSGGDGGNGDRKALFSNERTFIHWIKFGILLGSLALILCNFGTVGSLAFHVGVSVLVIAMSALSYAAISFHRRDRSLSRRLRGALARKQAKNESKVSVTRGSSVNVGGGLGYFHQFGEA